MMRHHVSWHPLGMRWRCSAPCGCVRWFRRLLYAEMWATRYHECGR